MRVVAAVVLALVLVTGCGSGGETPATSEPPATVTPEPDLSSNPESESSGTTEAEAESARRVKRRDSRRAAARKAVRRFAILDVVDWDTVRVDYRGGVSVRVIGIDTPETVSPSVPDECGGQAASKAARGLLTGKSVTMAFDPTQDRGDRYGRPLVYLGVPGVGDFGRAMIQRGRAAEYTYWCVSEVR